MRKMLSTVLLAACMAAGAQVNPKEGYIITLQGDTIHGTVDYRTEAINARKCRFLAQGEQQFREYAPADISGYRLTGNGAYYVSRTFDVEGTSKTVFAEYLLKGGVSLYYLNDDGVGYYFFADEQGRVASMKKDETLYRTGEEGVKAKRENMREATQMFAKSPKAMGQLWSSDYQTQDLMRMTREYNEEYCTEAGECIQFMTDERKRSAGRFRFRVEAGLQMNTVVVSPLADYSYLADRKFHVTHPTIGVGVDLSFPRFSQGLTAQAMVSIGKIKGTEDGMSDTRAVKDMYQFEAISLSGHIGAAYSFLPKQRLSPVVLGGLSIDYLTSLKIKGLENYMELSAVSSNPGSIFNIGFYVGGGVDVVLGQHSIRLSVCYDGKGAIAAGHGTTIPTVAVNVGFLW